MHKEEPQFVIRDHYVSCPTTSQEDTETNVEGSRVAQQNNADKGEPKKRKADPKKTTKLT